LLLPTQAILPGLLESAYRRELQNLFSKNVLARLWAKDTSLRPAEEYQAESVKRNLDWLDLPEQLRPLLARVVTRVASCAWGRTRPDAVGNHPQQHAREKSYRCAVNFVSFHVRVHRMVRPNYQRKH